MNSGSWLCSSRRQSNMAPIETRLDLSSAIRASVNTRGWTPVLMAAFSAGSPNESNPIGDRTPYPLIVRYRTMRSPNV